MAAKLDVDAARKDARTARQEAEFMKPGLDVAVAAVREMRDRVQTVSTEAAADGNVAERRLNGGRSGTVTFLLTVGRLCARQPNVSQVCLQVEKAAQVAEAATTITGKSVDSASRQPAAGQREPRLQSQEIDELKDELRMVRPPGGAELH